MSSALKAFSNGFFNRDLMEDKGERTANYSYSNNLPEHVYNIYLDQVSSIPGYPDIAVFLKVNKKDVISFLAFLCETFVKNKDGLTTKEGFKSEERFLIKILNSVVLDSFCNNKSLARSYNDICNRIQKPVK